MHAFRFDISSFTLKIAAIVGMTCNHIAHIFPEEIIASCPLGSAILFFLYSLGGITFPVMAFLLTEGFVHTSSLKRYAGRLALFACIAQIPYSLLWGATGNVLFTLLISLGLLWAYENSPYGKNHPNNTVPSPSPSPSPSSASTPASTLTSTPPATTAAATATTASAIAANSTTPAPTCSPDSTFPEASQNVSRETFSATKPLVSSQSFVFMLVGGVALSSLCDWGVVGPILVLLFYLFKPRGTQGLALALSVPAASTGLPALAVLAANATAGAPSFPFEAVCQAGYAFIGMTLAGILLSGYRGRRGYPLKYFFYLYYPAHLFVIWLVRVICFT